MLTQLTVKNHTLVESLDLDFEAGLSAITGETGAGKSILLNALGLTLGDRADFNQVRAGAKRAEIHADFDISKLPTAKAFLCEHELDEDNQCILRRVVNTNGSSKAWINGQPVTLGILRDLAEKLISVHSQHEHQSLLRADYQQEILDSYASSAPLTKEVALAFSDWQFALKKLQEMEANLEEHIQRKELLEFQLKELDELSLQDGEFEQLEQEQKQLANAEQILKALFQASSLLSEDESFNVLNAMRQITQLVENIDIENSDLNESRQLLSDSLAQLEEARESLRRTADQIQLDPERLNEVEERLSCAFDLARKHRCEPNQLPERLDSLSSELHQLSDLDGGLDRLKAEIRELESAYLELANELSQKRTTAAESLGQAVEAHMNELNMQGAGIQFELKPIEPSARGLEQCSILIRTNAGQELRPLSRIASGGELSRVSLAIQVETAKTSDSPTLIFDEVDVGIGGATATVVGKKLRVLGEHAQVICVTHLAQVASQAHQQLNVVKMSREGETQTLISPLDSIARKQEIARMLSGDTESEHSLKHAEELLNTAQA